ncbi:uncharacterized protein BDZ99DRAFT_458260 [Mytilinidion resinicola]|uniref:Uncharacterized protein n=1 Tax=Mytilinidion resinicola TaxID=574789 RepID=A0A6A6Z7Y6_9PEZI|nr:uncharacterized protein BDZ99DRAFT_458260 [Mytilinidion resinicola]KAF2816385.1 hypothetical protein BDZ99DRAFT_458260 [Mytilinidion resinicola]
MHFQAILASSSTSSDYSPRLLDSSNSSSISSPNSTSPFLPATRSVPVLFPGLTIGGVSLACYPRFQLKFILQICVHHLGEVETLLGLPAGFCVSKSGLDGGEATAAGGILHPVLVRTVMMEAEETVKGIKRVLAELGEDLKGSIQV